MKVLDGPLSEVLSLGDPLRLEMALDDGALDTALSKLDREADPDRPTADDYNASLFSDHPKYNAKEWCLHPSGAASGDGSTAP
jgi:hypothetical protein